MIKKITDQYGTTIYFSGKEVHRDHGPAIIYKDGSQLFYKHRKLHREYGPALMLFGRSGEATLFGYYNE